MRIVFMGTPAFARDILDVLLAASGHEVIAVYCQPARPGGRRGAKAVPSLVEARAVECAIPVFTPRTLRDVEAQTAFAALNADVAVVAAYGLILPQAVLDAPHLGCLNVHASLLPRWRGAAPIQRAILAGDAETGVDIMQMEAGLDTGPVLAEARTTITGKSAGELTNELAALGARLLVEVLGDLSAYPPHAQAADGVTYAAKIAKEELRLDFSRTSAEVERQVRAFDPPGAWFEVSEDRVRVLRAAVVEQPQSRHPGLDPGSRYLATEGWSGTPDQVRGDGVFPGTVIDDHLTIACGDGAIRPSSVQRAGRGVMTTAELLRGFPIPAGTRL